jgi:hypothetical protein
MVVAAKVESGTEMMGGKTREQDREDEAVTTDRMRFSYLTLMLREKCAGYDDVLYRRGVESDIKGNCGQAENETTRGGKDKIWGSGRTSLAVLKGGLSYQLIPRKGQLSPPTP